jgi:biotin carboxyl carrier protein
MICDFTIDGKHYRLEVERREGQWHCLLDGYEMQIDAILPRRDVLSLLIEGESYEVKRDRTRTETYLWVGGSRYTVDLQDPRSFRRRKHGTSGQEGRRELVATMPGKVVRVLIPEKGEVKAGQGVLVVEAMKMQNEVKSPKDGTVEKIIAGEGTNVNAGDVLAIVE